MYWVSERKLKDKTPVTRLFLAKRAKKEMDKHAPTTFAAQLDRWQENGFANYLGVSVRSEGQGVWRIGPGGDNFRLLGFFEFGDTAADDFIVILGGWKPKKKVLQEWIAEVARTRDERDWSRVDSQDAQKDPS